MPSKPTLYYALMSPPSRAVVLTANAIGLDLDLIDIPKVSESEVVAAINPLKTIPTLNDNGTIVTDSHVITAYLVDKYAKDDKLYPKDPEKRRKVDAALFFDACNLFARVRVLADPIFFKGATTFPEENQEYLHKSLDLLEVLIGDKPYICGDHITIADFHAVTSVTSGILAAPINGKYSKIKAWIARLSELPYYQKVNGAGLEILGGFIKRALEAKGGQ